MEDCFDIADEGRRGQHCSFKFFSIVNYFQEEIREGECCYRLYRIYISMLGRFIINIRSNGRNIRVIFLCETKFGKKLMKIEYLRK